MACFSKMRKEDEIFVKGYLNYEEQVLFNQLKTYEKKHALRVAKGLATSLSQEEREAIRLGLLHDIGKIEEPLSVVEKSMMVLLHGFTKGKIKNWNRLRMVRGYYEHPQRGYERLKRIGNYSETFLNCVRDHHELQVESEWLKYLKEWDDKA